MNETELLSIQARRMAAAALPGNDGMWIVSSEVLDDIDRLVYEVRLLQLLADEADDCNS